MCPDEKRMRRRKRRKRRRRKRRMRKDWDENDAAFIYICQSSYGGTDRPMD